MPVTHRPRDTCGVVHSYAVMASVMCPTWQRYTRGCFHGAHSWWAWCWIHRPCIPPPPHLVWGHKETRSNILQQKAQPRPANDGSVALFVFVCNTVKSEPPDARVMAKRHLGKGEELTQEAQETFDSRLAR